MRLWVLSILSIIEKHTNIPVRIFIIIRFIRRGAVWRPARRICTWGNGEIGRGRGEEERNMEEGRREGGE